MFIEGRKEKGKKEGRKEGEKVFLEKLHFLLSGGENWLRKNV